jgi:hypothetical protein
MRDIRVDDDVFAQLQSQAVPLVDSPNDVLRRILGLNPREIVRKQPFKGQSTEVSNLGRIHTGRRRRFRNWVLEDLLQHGGSAPAEAVIERIGERLEPQAYDLEQVKPGINRWKKDVHFARLELKNSGLIEESHQRGQWQLSQRGLERAKSLASELE